MSEQFFKKYVHESERENAYMAITNMVKATVDGTNSYTHDIEKINFALARLPTSAAALVSSECSFVNHTSRKKRDFLTKFVLCNQQSSQQH